MRQKIFKLAKLFTKKQDVKTLKKLKSNVNSFKNKPKVKSLKSKEIEKQLPKEEKVIINPSFKEITNTKKLKIQKEEKKVKPIPKEITKKVIKPKQINSKVLKQSKGYVLTKSKQVTIKSQLEEKKKPLVIDFDKSDILTIKQFNLIKKNMHEDFDTLKELLKVNDDELQDENKRQAKIKEIKNKIAKLKKKYQFLMELYNYNFFSALENFLELDEKLKTELKNPELLVAVTEKCHEELNFFYEVAFLDKYSFEFNQKLKKAACEKLYNNYLLDASKLNSLIVFQDNLSNHLTRQKELIEKIDKEVDKIYEEHKIKYVLTNYDELIDGTFKTSFALMMINTNGLGAIFGSLLLINELKNLHFRRDVKINYKAEDYSYLLEDINKELDFSLDNLNASAKEVDKFLKDFEKKYKEPYGNTLLYSEFILKLQRLKLNIYEKQKEIKIKNEKLKELTNRNKTKLKIVDYKNKNS